MVLYHHMSWLEQIAQFVENAKLAWAQLKIPASYELVTLCMLVSFLGLHSDNFRLDS